MRIIIAGAGRGGLTLASHLQKQGHAEQRADVVVAMLHRDADNLAVASLARALGAKRVMVRMRDPLSRPVYEAAGVQQILSETEVLVGALATAIEFDVIEAGAELLVVAARADLPATIAMFLERASA